MEEAMRRHFFNGRGDGSGEPHDKKNCHWCQIRAFKTHQEYPISIVTDPTHNAVLQPSFEFRETSIRGADVKPTNKEFLSGCDCKNGENCQYNDCTCLQDVDDDSSEDEDEVDFLPRKKVYAYHTHGARAGHLRSKILTSRNPIYECHKECKCPPTCPNRVVERGRQIPLQIFYTGNRGWGVRSPVDIKKGQFVDTYIGEVITAEEANRRRNQSHITQKKDVYLFALDKFSDPESYDERLTGPPLEVDGEFMSGPSRFINHSCDPSLRIFARVGDHAEKHCHDLAFFAIRDIPRGEELTFDYVDGVEDSEMDALDPEKQKDMTRCLCGSENCRGYLW
ncbi:SET domain-containing protein [Xylariaceae sp. FL1019]|nr:SET domain-containing protein [Xylariaceae sp. FL1019]